MYIGREFEIKNWNKLYIIFKVKLINGIKTDRSCIDLFLLSLLRYFDCHEFNYTFLIKFFNLEKVIIVNFHPELFRYYKTIIERKIVCLIYFQKSVFLYINLNLKPWRIKKRIRDLNIDQVCSKFIKIESKSKIFSVSFAHDETIKMTPYAFLFGREIAF